MAYPAINTGPYGQNTFEINETLGGTPNGSATVFSLANTPVSGSEQIYRDGQLLKSGAGNDYTISGATITMTSAPVTNTVLLGTYQEASSVSANADTLDGQHAPSGTIVGTSDTQTLTNKTLTEPTITWNDTAQTLGVNFKAHMSSAQNMTNAATYYTCQIDTEQWDIGSDFNTSTYQFTAPTTGYYMITFKVGFVNCAASDQVFAGLFKNTSTNICRLDMEVGTAGAITLEHTSVFYLAAADTLEVKAQNNTTAGKGIGNGTHSTTFGGYLLSV